MKQMTCPAMGGPADCTTIITGSTGEEMVNNGMNHINHAHPEMAVDINKMTKEEITAWMEDFQKKFEVAPEM